MAKAKLKDASFTSVYMDAARGRKLKALSKKTLIPQQVLIRMGLDMVFAKYSTKEGAK